MRIQWVTRRRFYIYHDDGSTALDVELGESLDRLSKPQAAIIAVEIMAAMERLLESPAAKRAAVTPGLFEQEGAQ